MNICFYSILNYVSDCLNQFCIKNREMDILMVPKRTPRELLYIETGLIDPITISKKQKIMTNYKMSNSTSIRNQRIANHEGEGTWREKIDECKMP